MRRSIVLLLLFFTAAVYAAQPDLRLELVRESLTGTHYRWRQYAHGLPVAGGEVDVTEDGREPRILRRLARVDEQAAVPDGANAAVNVDGVVRYARRVVRRARPLEPVAYYYDAETDALLRVEPLYFTARTARVFDPNPVVATNDPTLQDQNNSAAAVPPSAYRVVELPELADSAALTGPNAQIVDREAPHTISAGAADTLFDRSESGFEDVNAYYHVDASQRYLQSLGYAGPRQIVAYSIPIDTHAANGTDNSYFIPELRQPAHGVLYFGDGGTDDAEDADLVVHEYGHAILHWIAPNTFAGSFGSQARAIGEGFGDYWAFSAHYAQRVASGRDPYCFADWDARCWKDDEGQGCGYKPGTDCLRRLDSNKTMADYVDGEAAGTEHLNGAIWSSALRELFQTLGKRVTDTLVIESAFGVPSNPTFGTMASQMIIADRLLYGGGHVSAICAVMGKRGIFAAGGCGGGLPPGLTYHESGDRALAIPDNSSTGIESRIAIADVRAIDELFVRVDIAHPSRGDLRIALVAPDGTEVLLQPPALDRATDLHVTYGLDVPVAALAALHGRAAAGVWTLRIQDLSPRDSGVLRSWSLVVRYVGQTDAEPNRSGAVIPVAGHVEGFGGQRFVTDLRILNPGSSTLTTQAVFTPRGGAPIAVDVTIPPRSVAAFDDVVAQLFHTAGIGQITVGGGRVTSRTYTTLARGTLGQSINPPFDVAASRISTIPRIENIGGVRANIGFTEVGGASGRVRVRLFEANTGDELADDTYDVTPYGQVQFPVVPRGRMTADVAVVAGNASIIPYASLISSQGGDTNFVAAIPVPDRARTEYAPAMNSPAPVRGRWRTEVWITTVVEPPEDVPIVVTYTDAQSGAEQVQEYQLPPAHQTIILRDIVASEFGRISSLGVVSIELPPGVIATSRTGYDANYGETIPFVESSSGTDIPLVENNADFRTNIAIIGEAEASLINVEIFDAKGLKIDERQLFMRERRLWQFPVTVPVTHGSARITTLAGRVRAIASVIDNTTFDLHYVPAQ